MKLRLNSAVARLAVAAGLGLAVGLGAGFAFSWVWGVLAGLAVEGVLFTVLTWVAFWPRDAEQTRKHAQRDEFRPGMEEAVIVAVVVSGVVGTLVLGLVGPGDARVGAASLALVGVLMQWFGLHAMYSARYAFEYYDDGPGTAGREAGDPAAPPATREPGGIDFNDSEAPSYRDFLYFSYNLGMTYQVSDNNVSTTTIRSVVLRHCLLSYLFALIILATTVNLVTGIFTTGGS